jgi:hypothetical protein
MSYEEDHNELIRARIEIARLQEQMVAAKDALAIAVGKSHSAWTVVSAVVLAAIAIVGLVLHYASSH